MRQFCEEREVYFRESACGHNRAAYFIGKRYGVHVLVVFKHSNIHCSLSSCLRMSLSALHFAAFWYVTFCCTFISVHLCWTASFFFTLFAYQACLGNPAHFCRVGVCHHHGECLVYLRAFLPFIYDSFSQERYHACRGAMHDPSRSVRVLHECISRSTSNNVHRCGYGPSLNQAQKWNVKWFFDVRIRSIQLHCS